MTSLAVEGIAINHPTYHREGLRPAFGSDLLPAGRRHIELG